MPIQTVKIPIASPVYSGVDGVELDDANAQLVDGYRDEFGATVSRPGLSSLVDLGGSTAAPVRSLYYWPHQNSVIATVGGALAKLTYEGKVIAATALSGVVFNPSKRATFATDGTYVFAAAGGRIHYSNGTGYDVISDLDAPTQVTHVAYLDGYLLANNLNTNTFYYADVNSPFSWNGLSFASAAGNADYISALTVLNREVYLFGSVSLEIWENDGTTPFSRVPGGFINVGCAAPTSIINTEEALFWLDNRRHFVRFAGRSIDRISSPFDRVIQSFDTVADCYADRIEIASKEFFVWHFPTANRTLVHNATDNDWSEWGRWDSEQILYDRWAGDSYCYPEPWGVQLVGSRIGSNVYTMSPSYYTDAGSKIRLLRKTGHLSYGTLKEKRSHEIRIRLKRGQGQGTSTAPKLMLRWCDNGKDWSPIREISLGLLGEYEHVIPLKRTGIYRTRQYEFSCSDPVSVIFLDCEEDIEVLR
jgi:hypothetical protein